MALLRPVLRSSRASRRGASALAAASLAAAAPALADPAAPSGAAPYTVDAVTVRARAAERGAAFGGEIKPELQLDASDIQAFGVSTVAGLLGALKAETRGGGREPVVLLNGHRISGFGEIGDTPTEAVQRVDILPEAEALKYGYGAGQRVVNIVLVPVFGAVTGELTGGGPTEGGQVQGQGETGLFHVAGRDRLNLDLKYQGASELTEAARGVVSPAPSAPFALAGNVVGAAPGREIDPALSALVGRPVTIAGVPANATSGAPALADFASTADAPNTTDVRSHRTLAAANQSILANGVIARGLGERTSLTLNVSLGATTSEATQGLPGVMLAIPAGDPFSPFGQAVTLDRYAAGVGPLRQAVEGWTGHVGTTLDRDQGRWRFSLTGAYDHGDTWTATGAGVDPAPLQAALDARSPTLNPFAPFAAGLVRPRPETRAESRTDAFDGQLLGNGPLFSLPAGPINASLRVGDTESWLAARSTLGGAGQQTAGLARNDASAQVSLDVPIASRDGKGLGFLGELTLNQNTAVDWVSDFGALLTIGYGAAWSPLDGLNLIVSKTLDHTAPSQAQLGAPGVLTPGTPVFDYVTGQTVEVTTLSGGDRGLKADTRDVTKVGLTWRPIAGRPLVLTVNYVATRIDNPIASLPAATAQIEAAFPDHFIRDPGSALVEVDERAVNFTREDRSEISWGLTYVGPVGARPSPRAGGWRVLLSLHHTVVLQDRILMRPGGPRLDLLDGGAAGSAGGQPRHAIQAQALLSRGGVGASLGVDWRSATTVRDPAAGAASALRFSDLGVVDLRVFADLGLPGLARRWPILKGTRVTLSVSNLFDTRMRVRDAAGLTPIDYQPAYLDPEGRVASLGLRKLFN